MRGLKFLFALVIVLGIGRIPCGMRGLKSLTKHEVEVLDGVAFPAECVD